MAQIGLGSICYFLDADAVADVDCAGSNFCPHLSFYLSVTGHNRCPFATGFGCVASEPRLAPKRLIGSTDCWNDGAAKPAIVDFVARVTNDGSPDFVAPPERIAVFDNDVTLWPENPMPFQLAFVNNRLRELSGTIDCLMPIL